MSGFQWTEGDLSLKTLASSAARENRTPVYSLARSRHTTKLRPLFELPEYNMEVPYGHKSNSAVAEFARDPDSRFCNCKTSLRLAHVNEKAKLIAFSTMCARQDSNLQPLGSKPSTLSLELRALIHHICLGDGRIVPCKSLAAKYH